MMEWTSYLSQNVKGPSGCSFAFVWASVLNIQDVELEARRLSLTEREHFCQKKQNVSEDFWRAMGFRPIISSTFFCFAKDPNHPSHSLLSQDDYIRPCVIRFAPLAEDQHFTLMNLVL